MGSNHFISGEQALDDYFSSLLDDGENVEEKPLSGVSDMQTAGVAEAETAYFSPDADWHATPQPQVSPIRPADSSAESLSYAVPNLDDVEKLLKQLETIVSWQ